MAGLARRIAPAAALGGLAVVAVGVFDPFFMGVGASSAATAGTTTTAVTSPAPSTTSESSTSTEPATGAESGTSTDPSTGTDCSSGEVVTGDAIQIHWGTVQVAATVANGQICEVHAVAYPTNDGRSQQINASAVPQLDAAATASPTSFDYVSGATFTSQAYQQSLQSILDTL